MMNFFCNNRVSNAEPYEPSPSSLLSQFAVELDRKLTEKRLTIINGPGLNLIEFASEIRVHEELIGNTFKKIQTANGTMLAKFCYSDLIDQSSLVLSMATTEEIDAYYKKIAEVTLQRGTTNCEGLAAVALLLSEDLYKNESYHKIQVQICQLLNWQHIFVRFQHMDESDGLFYDPWYQRCQTMNPEAPVLIKENEFHEQMRDMLSHVYSQPEQSIRHIDYFHDFNAKTRQLGTREIMNGNDGYGYSIIYSSMTSPPSTEKNSQTCMIS